MAVGVRCAHPNLRVLRVLNHTLPGIMAVYNHQDYLPERKKALELWGEYLDRLQNADLSNVVKLGKAAPIAHIQPDVVMVD